MSGEGVHNPLDETEILADLAIIDAIVDEILEDTEAIREVTDAEAVLEETAGQITTDGSEQVIYMNNAPAGVFRPICVKVNFWNQTATETVILRTYYRIAVLGAMALQDEVTYAGAQDPELINIDLEPNRYGIMVTIEHTVGETNQAYDWEAFYEVHP